MLNGAGRNSDPVRLSIIVPALNEAANLPHVLPRIPSLSEIEEVLLVDGTSTDGTAEVALRLMPSIRIIQQDGRGKGNAVRCGVRAAQGNCILILDADGSHAPEEIPAYVAKAKEGYELVKGSRYMVGGGTEDETPSRAVMVRLVDLVANIMWQTRFTDMAYGMYLMDRQQFLDLDLRADYFDIEWELLIKAKRKGLRIVRVPSREAARLHGTSHLTFRHDGWLIFKVVMKEGLKGVVDKVIRLGRRREIRG